MSKGIVIKKSRPITAYSVARAYMQDALVIKDDKIYRSNSTIAPGTAFVTGTLINQWTQISKSASGLTTVYTTDTAIAAVAGNAYIVDETADAILTLPEADTMEIDDTITVYHIGEHQLTIKTFDGNELVDNMMSGWVQSRYNASTMVVADAGGTKAWFNTDFSNGALALLVRTDIEDGEQHVHLDDATLILEKPLQLENMQISSLGDIVEFKSETDARSVPVVQPMDDNMESEYPIAKMNGGIQEDVDYYYPGQTFPVPPATIDTVYRTADVPLTAGELYTYEVTPTASSFVQKFKIKLADGITIPTGIVITARGWVGPKVGEPKVTRIGKVVAGWVEFQMRVEYSNSLHTFELSADQDWGVRSDTSINSPVPANNHPGRKGTVNARGNKNVPAYPGFEDGMTYHEDSVIVEEGVLWAMRASTPPGAQSGTFIDNYDLWYKVGTDDDTTINGNVPITVEEFNTLETAVGGTKYVIVDDGILKFGEEVTAGQLVSADYDITDGWGGMSAFDIEQSIRHDELTQGGMRGHSNNLLGESLCHYQFGIDNNLIFTDIGGTRATFLAQTGTTKVALRNNDIITVANGKLYTVSKTGGAYTLLRDNVNLADVVPGTDFVVYEDTSTVPSSLQRINTATGAIIQISPTIVSHDPMLESWSIARDLDGSYFVSYRENAGGNIVMRTVSTPGIGALQSVSVPVAFKTVIVDNVTGLYWFALVDISTNLFLVYDKALDTSSYITTPAGMGLPTASVTCSGVSDNVAVVNGFVAGVIKIIDFTNAVTPVLLNDITDVEPVSTIIFNSDHVLDAVYYPTTAYTGIRKILLKRRGAYTLLEGPGLPVTAHFFAETEQWDRRLLLAGTSVDDYHVKASKRQGTIYQADHINSRNGSLPTTYISSAEQIVYDAASTGDVIGTDSFTGVISVRSNELSTTTRRMWSLGANAGVYTGLNRLDAFIVTTSATLVIANVNINALTTNTHNGYSLIHLTWDAVAKTISLYVDGELGDSTTTGSAVRSMAGMDFIVGQAVHSAHKGYYDTWMLFRGALPATVIRDMYKTRRNYGLTDTAMERGFNWNAQYYFVEDVIVQDNKRYICNTEGVQSGLFTDNLAKWDLLDYADLIRTNTYVSGGTYSLGDPVVHKGVIYYCNADWGTQTGSFADNASKWTKFNWNAPQTGVVKGRKFQQGADTYTAGGWQSYTFAVPFEEIPTVVASVDLPVRGNVVINDITTTGFRAVIRNIDISQEIAGTFNWIALGADNDMEETPTAILTGRQYEDGEIEYETGYVTVTFDTPFPAGVVPIVHLTAHQHPGVGTTDNDDPRVVPYVYDTISNTGFQISAISHNTNTWAPCHIQWSATGPKVESAVTVASGEREVSFKQLATSMFNPAGGNWLGGSWEAFPTFANTVDDHPTVTGAFVLKAGKTYQLDCQLHARQLADIDFLQAEWREYPSGTRIASLPGGVDYMANSNGESTPRMITGLIKPTVDTAVAVYINAASAANSIHLLGAGPGRMTSMMCKEI